MESRRGTLVRLPKWRTCAAVVLTLLHTACSPSAPPLTPTPPAPLPRDVVMRAAAPFYGTWTRPPAQNPDERALPQRLTGSSLLEALTSAPLVCIGETHDSARDHYVQLRVLGWLADHSQSTGERLAVGFEAFRRPAQEALDAYFAGTVQEAELLRQTDYAKNWGFDFSLYRPLLELAKTEQLKVLALNAPRDWTRKVAKLGLSGIDESLRQQLPELDLSDPVHRKFFETAMGAHPTQTPNKKRASKGGHPMPSLEKFYAAQVVWDETMAETASEWFLAQKQAGHAARVVILAGAGHCHESAIPRRLSRRTGAEVLSVRPKLEGDLDTRRKPAEASSPADQEFDLLLVSPGSPLR